MATVDPPTLQVEEGPPTPPIHSVTGDITPVEMIGSKEDFARVDRFRKLPPAEQARIEREFEAASSRMAEWTRQQNKLEQIPSEQDAMEAQRIVDERFHLNGGPSSAQVPDGYSWNRWFGGYYSMVAEEIAKLQVRRGVASQSGAVLAWLQERQARQAAQGAGQLINATGAVETPPPQGQSPTPAMPFGFGGVGFGFGNGGSNQGLGSGQGQQKQGRPNQPNQQQQ